MPPKLKNTKFHQTYKSLLRSFFLRSSVSRLPVSCLPTSVFGLRSPNNINHMNPINSFGPKPFATKTQKHQISPNIQIFTSVSRLPVSCLPTSVFGLRSPNNINHLNPINSFGPKPFATKTQKHQISPNIQIFTSVFGLRSPNFGLRSPDFGLWSPVFPLPSSLKKKENKVHVF